MYGPTFPIREEMDADHFVSPQQDHRGDWATAATEIDEGGISQTHKGYGRRADAVPKPPHTHGKVEFVPVIPG